MKQTTKKRNSVNENNSYEKQNIIDFFAPMEVINDFPIIPGKKDFMHIRAGFLLNRGIKK